MDIHVYIYGRVKHEFELEMTAHWNELIMFCYYFTFLLFSKNIGLKMNEFVEQLLSINLEKIMHKTRPVLFSLLFQIIILSSII